MRDFEWTDPLWVVIKDDGTYAVGIGYARYASKIIIPDTYKGKPVTEIGCFGDDTNRTLTELVIPKSIISFAWDCALGECRKLKTIYYAGTEEEWDKISKEYDYKTYDIHYNYVP